MFIDLSKAFDTVVHELFLAKLECFNSVELDLLESCLSDRKQITVCNGVSSMVYVPAGVQQGGVLSPLLFIIFINDDFSLPIKSTPSGLPTKLT